MPVVSPSSRLPRLSLQPRALGPPPGEGERGRERDEWGWIETVMYTLSVHAGANNTVQCYLETRLGENQRQYNSVSPK